MHICLLYRREMHTSWTTWTSGLLQNVHIWKEKNHSKTFSYTIATSELRNPVLLPMLYLSPPPSPLIPSSGTRAQCLAYLSSQQGRHPSLSWTECGPIRCQTCLPFTRQRELPDLPVSRATLCPQRSLLLKSGWRQN